MNFLKYFDKKFRFVGIDIGEDYLACVEQKDGRIINSLVLDGKSYFSGSQYKIEALENDLKNVKEAFPDKDVRFNLAMPATQTFVRVVDIPEKDVPKKEAFLFQTVVSQLPFPIETVFYDWIVQPIFKETPHGKQFKLLFVAVKREAVERLTGTLKSLGLEVGVLETEFFSCQNAVEALALRDDKKFFAILYIGKSYSFFNLSFAGSTFYCGDFGIGYGNISEEFYVNFGISDTEALRWLLDENFIGNDYRDARFLRSSGLENLAKEIARNLSLIQQAVDFQASIENVFVLGPISSSQQFISLLESATGLVCTPLRVGEQIYPSCPIKDTHLLVKAFGLSLRHFGDKE